MTEEQKLRSNVRAAYRGFPPVSNDMLDKRYISGIFIEYPVGISRFCHAPLTHFNWNTTVQ